MSFDEGETLTQKNKNWQDDLADKNLMQELQDRYCAANNLYAVCFSRDRGVVTRAYGTKEQLAFVHSKVDMDRHLSLLRRALSGGIENVVEEQLDDQYTRCCAVAINVDGKPVIVWIVIAFLRSEGEDIPDLPDYIATTTEERYYKSMEFLEALSKQYFAVKMEERFAEEAYHKSNQNKLLMELQLKKSEAMTSIVQLLESADGFVKISEDILREVSLYMSLGSASILRINRDNKTVDMIGEWVTEDGISYSSKCKNIEIEKLPFITGKPYLISSNSMKPDNFAEFFEAYGIRAACSLPVEVNGTVGMYLCCVENKKERVWDVEEIKFLNDVRQIIQSILTKKIAKNSLTSSYTSLEAILENVGCGIYVKDPKKNKILYKNHKFSELFHHDDEFEKMLANRDFSNLQEKFTEVKSDVDNRWYDIHQTDISWVDGSTVMLCAAYDITSKKLYQQKVEKQANNDFLTGLYNRMRCEHDLEILIRQTKEFSGEGAMLYIDLDDFKHINDGLGHQYGDVLLKAISHSLQRINGIESSCYRMGGDEFIILISHHQYNMLNQILDEIRAIFTRPWFLKGADYYCTMSMGVVRFPRDGDTVSELIKKADIALYEAKKSGKNRIEFYDDNVASTSFKRLDMEKNMRDATMNACDEFEVYYQPIVNLSDHGDVCYGAEALIRWNSEKMGFISPTEFIPLAEYLGLINPIGSFVLEEACKRCKYWNDMGYPEYRINVNLSVVQLLQNDVVEKIRDVIKRTQIRPTNLTLEVTESLAINDMARMKRVLAEIKQLGVWVALDDFGTGYSSLNHIRELPIDIIKIDRCFVIDIGKDEYSAVFVKMVSELANTIGVRVCVEGVEEREQLERLRQMNVHYIQGYYFGKPMRVDAFEKEFL